MQYKASSDMGKNDKAMKIFLLILLLAAALAIAVFIMFSDIGKNLLRKKAEPAYVASGLVDALWLDALPQSDDNSQKFSETALKEYYTNAIDYAVEQGYNTVIYRGKAGLAVFWHDSVFPLTKQLEPAGVFKGDVDPLQLLCDAAKDKNVQIWVGIDPYNAEGLDREMKGKAVNLLGKTGGTSFAATDEKYDKLLQKSLKELPRYYPIAGIVLQNMNTVAGEKGEQSSWEAQFSLLADEVQKDWHKNERTVAFSLEYKPDGTQLPSRELEKSLVQNKLVQYILPDVAELASPIQTLSGFSSSGEAVVLPLAGAEQADSLLLAGAIFTGYSGAVYAQYPSVEGKENSITLLKTAAQPVESALPEAFVIPQELAVTYPVNGAKVYTNSVFIMGTSNPAEPLLLNGKEVPNRGEGGVFGIAVEIQNGENVFTFTQGSNSTALQLTKPEPTGGGGGQPQPDGTQEAEEGQAVQVTTQIVSALTDYTNASAINETFPKGAVAVVQKSVQNGNTWAYQLTSGDWLPANSVAWVPNGTFAFTGLQAQEDEKGEWLTFTGGGTPAAYVSYAEGSLKLTFYDTTMAALDGFSSKYVKSATVQELENGVEVILQLNPIWGYSLEYVDGNTKLFLKRVPQRGANPARPLEGITILLDPGHGADDYGALGVLSTQGPYEKDVNLALAQITAYRLRQMGAEVTLTREDDTFPTLYDRLGMQTEQKPDFFISLHHNSAELDRDRNDAKGSQVYYYHPYTTPASKQLAQNLIDRVAPATGRSGGEARWGYYYVTRTTACPSVLFEYGFMINPQEFEDITSVDGLYSAAAATADGVLATLPE